MIDAADLERLRAAGFTEQQISAIADTIKHIVSNLVTRDYLDLRLREERDYLDLRLREDLQLQKWSLLRWTLVMQIVTAAGLYIALRYGS
jgi:hypothetical protein